MRDFEAWQATFRPIDLGDGISLVHDEEWELQAHEGAAFVAVELTEAQLDSLATEWMARRERRRDLDEKLSRAGFERAD